VSRPQPTKPENVLAAIFNETLPQWQPQEAADRALEAPPRFCVDSWSALSFSIASASKALILLDCYR
jgi:hypothetical protein